MNISQSLKNKKSINFFIQVIVVCALTLYGCGIKDSSKDDEEDPTPENSVFNLTAITDESGEASVSFNLRDGSTKFSITAFTPDESYIRFDQLQTEDGTNYLNPNRKSISFADSLFRYVNNASVPSRSADANLEDDITYLASVVVSSSSSETPVSGKTVSFTIRSKDDSNLEGGILPVNLFYVGDVGQLETTKNAVASALAVFRDIYSSSANITLDVQEIDSDGPVTLPLPLDGDSFYREISEGARSPAVNLFIGGDLDDSNDSGDTLGMSGGIPGPPEPSERSGVAISIFAGAGSDGAFSSEDIRLLGETLAHESGHFMGLFHPVDFSGSTVSDTDPLDDTPTCSFITECIANSELVENLMFPSPIPDNEGGYIPQNQLTTEQRSVLNRYIVVD